MDTTPPEIPKSTPAPPPLPSRAVSGAAAASTDTRRKTVLGVVIGLVVAIILGLILVVAVAGLYLFSAQELELSDEVLEAVLTVDDAEEWFEIDIKREFEEWDAERYFDGSAQVYYYYNDDAGSIYINCNLTYEPKRSDALMAYGIEWGGLKLSNNVGPGESIQLDEQSDLFQWGDASKFAFQTLDGEPYGMAFVARKDGKVFFLDLWGMVLEEPEEIEEFLLPHLDALDALERSSFRKKPDQVETVAEDPLSEGNEPVADEDQEEESEETVP